MISAWTLFPRVLVAAIGLAGVLWSISEFSMFRRETTISKIARQVIDGHPFKPEILLNQASLSERVESPATCRPLVLRSATVVRLRIAELLDNASLAPALVRKDAAID